MHLAIYASAVCQFFPIMKKNTVKIGAFGIHDEDNFEGDANLTLRKLTLNKQYEKIIPTFFHPSLHLFIVVGTWTEGNPKITFYPTPSNQEDFQLILGKRNTRCLRTNNLCIFAGKFKKKVNAFVWLLEASKNSKYTDIQFNALTRTVKKFKLDEQTTATPCTPVTLYLAVSNQLTDLRKKLVERHTFIRTIHPFMEISLGHKDLKHKKIFRKTNEWMDVHFNFVT